MLTMDPYTLTARVFGNGGLSAGNLSFQESKKQNDYLHATLEQIDHLANEDVQMQAPLSELAVYVVVDTNVLLHHFEVLAQFVDDVERLTLPVIVVVPGAVVLELDGQKNREGLAWFARRATAWLLEKIRERKSVKGQAQEETCKSTGNWKIKERGELSAGDMYNDSLILDCCMYLRRGRPTVLCTGDSNLRIMCHAQGLSTITPTRFWSSRDLAQAIYGDVVDVARFGVYQESYKKAGEDQHVVEEDDRMMIDDEGEEKLGNFRSQHLISMLHDQVVEHFTRLLIELVGKVGGEEVRQRTTPEEEARMSRHAPRRRHYSEWTAQECLEYLAEKRPVKEVNPRASVFLKRSYRERGARPGREWTRQDWRVALSNLKTIATAWEDISIPESIYFLQPHVDNAFDTPFI